MKYTVDARGKQCPIPVVETKKVLSQMSEGDVTETLVDNEIAVQNLEKMAVQKNLKFTYEQTGKNVYKVLISFTENSKKTFTDEEAMECNPVPVSSASNTVVVLSSNKMGEGDEALGKVLMKGFVYALTSLEELPSTVLLYNNGAKLSIEGSESLEDLKLLESQGVEILTCGTCLNHYGIADKLAVGSVTNMYVICEKMTKAGKVVKP